MDNKKIGEFISTLRKNKNLTQKDLADKLGITDKAVSKWERGVGYPDISMLRPLADILDTSVTELLEGESSESSEITSSSDIASALDYVDKIIISKENKLGRLFSAIFSISLLLAIFTSVIVNIAVSSNLSWSILVLAGCLLGGCLFIPPMLWSKRGFLISLSLLTLLIIPFLKVIEYESERLSGQGGWLWRLGFPISVIWLIIIWTMVLFISKIKLSIWFNICILSILCIPGSLITNYVVDQFLGSNIVTEQSRQVTSISTVISILTLAGISFVIGILRKNKTNKMCY